MLNSTGGNTSGQNSNARLGGSAFNSSGSNPQKKRWIDWKLWNSWRIPVPIREISASRTPKNDKRDVVNLNLMVGKLNGSKISGSGNQNSVDVYVAGVGQDVVNITLYWDALPSVCLLERLIMSI